MIRKTLAQLYAEHQGKVSDKWAVYLAEYERLFTPYRDKPVRLLEIGVQNGGSLEIWAQYFPQATALVGCDINSDCTKLQYDDARIAVVVGDANVDATRQEILAHAPQFDLMIDDGSHDSHDIVRSFGHYFSRLRDGGLYVAEDLHCSYWQRSQGGLFHPHSAISFFKRLADIVNHEHWGVAKSRSELLQNFSAIYGASFDEAMLGHIHSIEFINSICVVRKMPPPANVLGTRVVAGQVELVTPGYMKAIGQYHPDINQSDNPWSVITMPVEEELMVRLLQLQELKRVLLAREQEIVRQAEIIAERDAEIVRLQSGPTN